MVESFGTGVVEADVVGGPFCAERVALGGELANEGREVAVVWVAAGFGAEDRDDLGGDVVPILVEVFCGVVAVVGDGAVGMSGVLAASRLGAERVIALSRNPVRQRLAREFGRRRSSRREARRRPMRSRS